MTLLNRSINFPRFINIFKIIKKIQMLGSIVEHFPKFIEFFAKFSMGLYNPPNFFPNIGRF
jgi:hypothetical protein